MLINREKVGEKSMDPHAKLRALLQGRSGSVDRGFDFGERNYRDALHLGDCDAGVKELCRSG